MVLALLFTLCLQLGSATSVMPRALDTPSRVRPEVQPLQSGSILAAQAVPPATDQTPASSQTPLPAQPASPRSTSKPGSQQSQSTSPTKTTPAPSTGTHKKKRHKAADAAPQKVVVQNGSTSDPAIQFSTAVSPEQASRDKQNTARLLAAADANLQNLSGHQLSPSQQDTSAQIRSYMQQANTAEEAGDLQGAHNLALKALLLSNELVRK